MIITSPKQTFLNLRDFGFKLKPLSMSSDLFSQSKGLCVQAEAPIDVERPDPAAESLFCEAWGVCRSSSTEDPKGVQ